MSNDRLRVLFCDHLSMVRGKYHPNSGSSGESRFCQSVFALGYDKDLSPVPHSKMLEGLPDMVAHYDGADIRKGWNDQEQVVIADLYDTDGEVLPVCGRSLLKRTVAQWKELGYNPKVGIELEAFAYMQDENGDWKPYDAPGACVYGTGPFSDPVGFTDVIWKRAVEAGFPLEMASAEFDSPQFEFTLRFDDALKAVDDIFLFRLLAKEVAFECGIHLSFMPKPIGDLVGSGVHVNFSLWDEKGNNVIGDSDAPEKLSAVGRGCVAGLMHHHRGLAGVLAPSTNSYERLQPGSFSGFWRNWGVDHRGVTTRISSESGDHARIEHRMADATCNPYTMTAAVLQAARLGFVNGYELGAPETADCFENQDAEDGVPETLSDALRALQEDTELVSALGEGLVGNLVGIKEVEVERTADLEGEALRDYYFHYV